MKTFLIILIPQLTFWLGFYLGSQIKRKFINSLKDKTNLTRIMQPKIVFNHEPTEAEIDAAIKNLDALMARDFPDFERMATELKTGNNPDTSKKDKIDFENSPIFNELKNLDTKPNKQDDPKDS